MCGCLHNRQARSAQRKIELTDRLLERIGSFLVCLVVLVAPWLFGAWEMWWFWLFTLLIFVAALCFSLRLLLSSLTPEVSHAPPIRRPPRRPAWIVLLTFLPFLAYATVRMLQTNVCVDAERSVLLFATPLLVAAHLVFGSSSQLRRVMSGLIMLDLCLLGLYGLVNHALTGSRMVLWAKGYELYTASDRASGSYFCPDHYAGIMELALCLALALLLTRNTGKRLNIAAALLAFIALAGVVLSKSRGGGLAVLVILGSGLVWGFWQWRPWIRWGFRAAALTALIAAVISFACIASTYTERFVSYFGGQELLGKSWEDARDIVVARVSPASRPRMIGAALRAWKTNPAFGIGPGMHQNLWPHFAATADGDRERGIWPRFTNHEFHSYEVHSDWVQLLEEYGLIGFGLFLVPALACFLVLLGALRHSARRPTDPAAHALVMAGLFAWVCMAFHSLGDFNMQMPATVWMLAAMLALALSGAAEVRTLR